MYDPNARLSAHQAAELVGVSRQLVNWWRSSGKLKPITTKGRSPLYRLADVLETEAQTRRSPHSRRTTNA